MSQRQTLTQEQKHAAFKTMARVYKQALEQENYVAAHVVAFSFLEDRIKALHFVREAHEKQKAPTNHQALATRVHRLRACGDISEELGKAVAAACTARNALFHTAMWNLDGFTRETAANAFELGRQADKARKTQKKTLGQ